ncbi:MAG TPA: formyltransferase family protein [Xanthomonadales bacterium]|nr:formyltransferase family protein [Xanthomonadales bacterium]
MSTAPLVFVLTSAPGPLPLSVAEGLVQQGFAVRLLVMGTRAASGAGRLAEYGWWFMARRAVDRLVERAWLLRNRALARRHPPAPIAPRDWRALVARVGAERPVALVTSVLNDILPRRVLDLPVAALNVHPAPLPGWRGPNPIYWMLRERATPLGYAVHALSRAIDEGPVFLQREIARPHLPLRVLVELAIARDVRAHIGPLLERILDGRANGVPQTGAGRYWPQPTLANLRSAANPSPR